MGDFGEFDDFQCEVQGRPIKIFKNGEFSNSKGKFINDYGHLIRSPGSLVCSKSLVLG